VTPNLPITTGTAYPILALRDAAQLADRARMRRQVRDAGYSAFAAAIAEMESAK
jgi:hypothetical protein